MRVLDAWDPERYFFGGYLSQDFFTMSSSLPAILVGSVFSSLAMARQTSERVFRVPQVQHERALGKRDSNNARAQPVPSGRIRFEFHFSRRSEPEDDVQVSSSRAFCQTSAVRSRTISPSICFFTRSLFSAGFLLFNSPFRIAKVLYFVKSASLSNSRVTFCARAPRAESRLKRSIAMIGSFFILAILRTSLDFVRGV